MMRTPLLALTSIAMASVLGCGSSQPARTRHTRTTSTGRTVTIDDNGRCETEGRGLEISEYDTSGDEVPDVRRVFQRMGEPPQMRLVLVCREADLNADGTKDIVRFYNEEGRPLREEADRNFDGQVDTITFFQEGRIVRTELDSNADGRIDTKIYFDDRGNEERTERDLAGRSTATEWHPDRWEYFEDGRMVRMGSDIDGDGRVDRWDRDRDRAPAPGQSTGTGNAADASDTTGST